MSCLFHLFGPEMNTNCEEYMSLGHSPVVKTSPCLSCLRPPSPSHIIFLLQLHSSNINAKYHYIFSFHLKTDYYYDKKKGCNFQIQKYPLFLCLCCILCRCCLKAILFFLFSMFNSVHYSLESFCCCYSDV